MQGLRAEIDTEAYGLGFSAVGICAPDQFGDLRARLDAFVDKGYHGQMRWLDERKTWRGNPAALWPEARSIIMLAENYRPDHDPLSVLDQPDKAAISVYAQNRDYHDVIKKKLKALGRWLISRAGGEIKVFVDTAPVMEKPLAQMAGLGWQGKHTNLVSRDLGSWFFLGSVFTTLEIATDSKEVDHCGSCRACLDICPTNAFPAAYQLDARRCISYLTIEHKGPIDPELRSLMGNRIYGCDDCLAVCPWNKFAQTAAGSAYLARDGLEAKSLRELSQLSDSSFRQLFSKNPIKRIGRDQFVRNICYAMGNSRNPEFRTDLQRLKEDPCETIKDAAHWALGELQND